MTPFDWSFWHGTTKTYTYFALGRLAFSEFFSRPKSDPTMFKSHFLNTMGNPILNAPFFKTKRSTKKKLYSNYIGLCVKTAFTNNFGPREVPKLENCTFTFMHFLVGALPEVQNCFWKLFLHKVPFNYNSKNFLKHFVKKKWRFKKVDFPLYFKNLIWPW